MLCITDVDDNLSQKKKTTKNTYSIKKLLSHYLILCIPLLQGTGFTLTLDA